MVRESDCDTYAALTNAAIDPLNPFNFTRPLDGESSKSESCLTCCFSENVVSNLLISTIDIKLLKLVMQAKENLARTYSQS